jgi:hypothetical protein
VIALFFGLKVMPTMDMICFYGGEQEIINFFSSQVIERYTIEKFKEKVKFILTKVPKLRYSIVNIMGDLYYKELTVE